MYKKKFLAAAFLFLGFLVMVLLTSTRKLVNIDFAATNGLQSLIPRSFDLPFSFFSLMGSTEVVAVVMLAIAGLVYFKFKKIFWGLGMMALIYVIEILGKYLIYHPGPPREFFRYAIPFAFPHYVATNYSFPSGHVSRAFFLAVIVVFLAKKLNLSKQNFRIVAIVSGLMSLVMLLSRVYLGEHWLSDTIGGVFLGSTMGTLAILLF